MDLRTLWCIVQYLQLFPTSTDSTCHTSSHLAYICTVKSDLVLVLLVFRSRWQRKHESINYVRRMTDIKKL